MPSGCTPIVSFRARLHICSSAARGGASAQPRAALLRRLRVSGGTMGQAPARYCQGRVASGRAVPRVGFIVTNLPMGARLNHPLLQSARHRRAAHHIKEGKQAINWTRLSCKGMAQNKVLLKLHALAYNLGIFLQGTDLPEEMADWSLTSLQTRIIKIGAQVVRHARAITFQLLPRLPLAALCSVVSSRPSSGCVRHQFQHDNVSVSVETRAKPARLVCPKRCRSDQNPDDPCHREQSYHSVLTSDAQTTASYARKA